MKQKTCWYWFTVLVLLFYFSMPRAHAKASYGSVVSPAPNGFNIKFAKDGTPLAVPTNGAGGVNVAGTVPVALSPTTQVQIVATAAIAGAQIGGPWGAAIGAAGIVIVMAIPAFQGTYDALKVRANPVTGALEKSDPEFCTVAPCYQYRASASYPWRDSRTQAANDWLAGQAINPSDNYRIDSITTTGGSGYGIVYYSVQHKVPAGSPWVSTNNFFYFAAQSAAPKTGVQYVPATVSEVQGYVSSVPPTVAQVDALADLGFQPDTGPVTITGPATVPASNTVKLFSDGTQQTEACTFYLEYFPSNIKAHPECTTTTVTPEKTTTEQKPVIGPDGKVVLDTNGNPVMQTIKTITPAKTESVVTTKDKLDDSSVPAVDTPLGTVPKLYTRQYPDGLTGVWAAKKTALLSSPLVNLTSALMPSVAPGGTCPVMMVNFDIGSWHFGTHDVAPPCYIWALCKWFILISAGLLCRRLIFGG